MRRAPFHVGRGVALVVASAACSAPPASPPSPSVAVPVEAATSGTVYPKPNVLKLELPERLQASVYYRLEQDPGTKTLWLRHGPARGEALEMKIALRALEAGVSDEDLFTIPRRTSSLGTWPAWLFEVPLSGGGFGVCAQAHTADAKLVELAGAGLGVEDRASIAVSLGSFRSPGQRSEGPPVGTRWHGVGSFGFAASLDLHLRAAQFADRDGDEQFLVSVSASCGASAQQFLEANGHGREEPERVAITEPRDETRTIDGVETRVLSAATDGPEGKRLLRLAASRLGVDCLLSVYQASVESGASVLTEDEWLALVAEVRRAAR